MQVLLRVHGIDRFIKNSQGSTWRRVKQLLADPSHVQ